MELLKKKLAKREDIERAIEELSDVQLARLERYARYQVYRYPSLDPKELLSEAVVRVLSGKRAWPLDVSFQTFLCNVMRSVASDFREEAKARMESTSVELGDDEVAQEWQTSRDRNEDRDFLRGVWELFKNDVDVQRVLQGIEGDLSAKEVQEEFSLTAGQYDAARKRLERALARKYPDGLAS